MQSCVFQLECSKNTEITKKKPKKKNPCANRERNASAWMGDLCITPSTEEYPYLGIPCLLTVGGKIPTGSQWAGIPRVVLYQGKPVQRDYIS